MNNINRLITWLLTGNIAVLIFFNSFGIVAFEYFPMIGTLNDKYSPFVISFIIELIAAKVCIYFLQREKN